MHLVERFKWQKQSKRALTAWSGGTDDGGGGGMGTERRKTLHGRFGDSSKKPRVDMGLGGKDAGTIGDLQCSRPALSCSPPPVHGAGNTKGPRPGFASDQPYRLRQAPPAVWRRVGDDPGIATPRRWNGTTGTSFCGQVLYCSPFHYILPASSHAETFFLILSYFLWTSS